MALTITHISGLALGAALLATVSTGIESAATTPLKLIDGQTNRGQTNRPLGTRVASVGLVDNLVYMRSATATRRPLAL
jgi:hypothetical protein